MSDPAAATSSVLTRAQIKTLLSLALDSPVTAVEPVLGRRAAMAQRLLDAVGARLGEPCGGIVAHTAHAATSLDDLRRTKALAKRLAAGAEDHAQREAAAFLYHLSIAAALHRHGEYISREPLQRQKDIHRRLARLFGDDATGDIFENASH